MNTIRQLCRRLLSLIRRRRLEGEMEDELRFHLEMQIDQNLSSGNGGGRGALWLLSRRD